MNYQNDDLRIKEINELLPPVALLEKFPPRKMQQIPLLTRAKPSIKFSKAMTIVCWW